MTENKIREFVQSLRNRIETFVNSGWAIDGLVNDYTKSADTIEKLFEEIQQYRAIGTVEECRTAYAKGYNQGTIDRAEEVTKAREQGYAKAIEEFAEQFCAACCENTFHSTINGIKNVEMMTLDGVTETIFEVAEKMKGGAENEQIDRCRCFD